MKKEIIIALSIFCGLYILLGCQKKQEKVTKVQEENLPNVILINADDLGYGDLGCYGATKLLTPFGGPAAISFAGQKNSDIENGEIKADASPAQLYNLEADPNQLKMCTSKIRKL